MFLEKENLSGSGYDMQLRPSKTFEKEHERKKHEFPELRPFRSLDAGRLKISGAGLWPLEKYLEGTLWLPFVEPRILWHGCDISKFPVPNFLYEDRAEYLRLARLWDDLGVLSLAEAPLCPDGFCRVFNVFKDVSKDRQIGDRRKVNAMECAVPGPSRNLPTGPLLLGMSVKRGSQQLLGSLTDRKDFYHQIQVNSVRQKTNMVPFAFSCSELSGLKALERFFEERDVTGPHGRVEEGDRLGEVRRRAPLLIDDDPKLYPAFSALFQGDHLGVEFALQGHQCLLQEEGLLSPSRRLQGGCPFPLTDLWEGLIIDDYFIIGCHDRKARRESSEVFLQLEKAREAYAKHRLPGSIEKDVCAECLFKAAGAEVDSRPETVDRGLTLVGAPLAKRFGLSLLSLRVAALDGISTRLAHRLSGSWVSTLLYRRCLSSIVDDLYKLGALASSSAENLVVPLTRKVAAELSMLAIMVPLMCSDVSATFHETVFATDASLKKGAIVSKRVDPTVAKILWLDGDRKGTYTKLDSAFKAILKDLGEENELLAEEDLVASNFQTAAPSPERPPLFEFDFVEICGGVGKVSRSMALRGYRVAPVLDLSNSGAYDLRDLRLLEWILHMIRSRLFRSAMLEPPCTTFSPAAHPACRSYECPEGWDRLLPKVLHGNVLAFRCLIILYVCCQTWTPGLLEQPRLSKMAWLSFWRFLLACGCQEAVVASCQFGSIHRKEFRLLVWMLDAAKMTVKCQGGHAHVPIQGQYTRDSAIYTDGVAEHFAEAFDDALQKVSKAEFEELDRKPVFESVLVNDTLRTSGWEVVRSWFWRSKSHINVLEASVVSSLLSQSIGERPGSRMSVLLDSSVTKGALSKGRSSSYALQPILRRSAACMLAGNLYVSTSFAPTKLNVADDPSREEELRDFSDKSLLAFVPLSLLRHLHQKPVSRATANWVRLALFLAFLPSASASIPANPPAIHLSHGFGFGFEQVVSWIWNLLFGFLLLGIFISWGLVTLRAVVFKQALHGQFHPNRCLAMVVFHCCVVCAGAPMVPLSSAEVVRASQRAHIELAADRVLRQQTRDNREKLLLEFREWLQSDRGVSWNGLFGQKPIDPEEINKHLVAYGRDLHAAGKSYTKYSETINAVVGLKPLLKRQMTSAWDLAFAWLIDEPHQHHPAMPMSVMLSLVCTALLWGWPVEGALIALTWSGVLRIGEVLGAYRRDLFLPSELAPGCDFILLRVPEPKTRGRGARHQSARIDPADLVLLISSVFLHYGSDQKLWPYSAATLRRKFSQLLAAVGLQTKVVGGVRPFDLGSLRPGGATWILNQTEDSNLVQRRGRWMSYRVMTIYLQEIAVATTLPKLSPQVRKTIQELNSVFPQVLQKAVRYLSFKIPCTIWYKLFLGQPGETV